MSDVPVSRSRGHDNPVPRVLLLLPTTTYRASDFLAAAAELGVEVVVASDARQTLAEVMRERALEVDFADPEGACAAIVETNISQSSLTLLS
jgi:hypothetical protein